MKSLALVLAATASFGLAAAVTSPQFAIADENSDIEFIEAPTMDEALAHEGLVAKARSQLDTAFDPASLSPGDYAWLDANAVNGRTTIVIDLSDQRAYVLKSGILVGVSTVSSGRPGYDTPTGEFEILEKNVEHYSNLYDDAPMPYMQRLSWDGIALHAGHNPGHPASHGCVRLPHQFAADLFEETQIGTRVIVTA